MDTLSHGLWALALFWGTSYRWWAFLVGMLPDFLSFGLYFVQRIATGGFGAGPNGPPPIDSLPSWVFASYDITHSLVTWMVIGLVLYFFARRVWPIVFAGVAHVALDIPTHCSYFPTPYLWPLPHEPFCGVGWSNPLVFGLNWLALGILFMLIAYYEWGKRRTKSTPGVRRRKTVSPRKSPGKLKKR